ncbi:MAG: molybdenum cofactor guanylyltransferase [Gammaproteobacteria bacterium]|nr:molybdenum cofactor guanylyltransferase [Gammaproteobacteria bacterium]MBU1413982.1 molybdenum cofactor guanylyltransferase [Gammaproteobacteria bacterium]
MSTPTTPTTGLILAGGLGRRMGGGDKGLEMLDGQPLVAHVIGRFSPQVDKLIINANRNAEAYAAFGYPVVGDLIEGFAGPLAGIQAGLRECTTPLLACAPCDSPRLPTDLVARLRDGLTAEALVAVPRTADGLQPVFALLRREVLSAVDAFLAGGGHALAECFRAMPLAIVDFPDAAPFANINTRDDLAAYHHG